MKPNTGRAKTAEIFIWLLLAVRMMAMIQAFMYCMLLGKVSKYEYVAPTEFDSNIMRSIILTVMYFVVYVVLIVMFIRWFRRAYYNQELKFGSAMKSSNGWAAGSWFVPVLNLYKPFLMMQEMFIKAENHLAGNEFGKRTKNRRILVWWWALLIGLETASRIVARGLYQSSGLRESYILTVINMLLSIVFIGFCIITVTMIRRYNAMEQEMSASTEELKVTDKDLLDSFI